MGQQETTVSGKNRTRVLLVGKRTKIFKGAKDED